jgi:hypothetical protein
MAAQDSASAPAYKIAPRNVYAVEHPMIVRNFHRGLQTFGTENPFEKVSVHCDCFSMTTHLLGRAEDRAAMNLVIRLLMLSTIKQFFSLLKLGGNADEKSLLPPPFNFTDTVSDCKS